MQFKIKVTKEHIAAGIPKDCKTCPIALAAQDAGLLDATVTTRDILWRTPESWYMSADLPDVARKFVESFDALNTIEPFEFTIEGT